MKLSRRTFLKYTAGSTFLTLLGVDRLTGFRHALAQIPGGTLNPFSIPKFASALLIPPVMPRAGVIPRRGRSIDYYEISVRQFAQQILPAGLPATTVWGYGAVRAIGEKALLIHNAPSLTIEARWDTPTRIKWVNELRADPADPTSAFLPHLLPVDPTLHWANPPGGAANRDTRPTFDATPGPYIGPVPIVTHLHGAAGVGDESDGYAEAWYLPVSGNIPSGYANVGTWYRFFESKARARDYLARGTEAWEPGTAVFQYPNSGRAATLWYHDHVLGMTRLNVYAGPAGFYLLRGGPEGDAALRDTRTGKRAVLPGPAPERNDAFPSDKRYYEIPIAIQDRSFNDDGSLFYPDTRAFFDGIFGPYIPGSDISPLWNPEFFGNTIMVNGNTWPYLDVERRRYRFRFLNGCNSRFLILDFAQIPGVRAWMIGTEGGFLAKPVNLTAVNRNTLPMGPAERADIIVDFTNVPRGRYVLRNSGPDEPFAGGDPGTDFPVADPESTGQIMEFRVRAASQPDRSTPPQFLAMPRLARLHGGPARPLALAEEMSRRFDDAVAEAVLGTVAFDDLGLGTIRHREWSDVVTENPALNATEVWEFYNGTVDAHPIHIHEALFQLVNRQALSVSDDGQAVRIEHGSAPVAPEPWEDGWKDTVIAYPAQVTRVRLKFETAGQYVWHCHIVEHEDNEMMRPYRIGPEQPNQPRERPRHRPSNQ